MFDNIITLEQLEDAGIGEVLVSIGHRGGHIGFYGGDVADFLGIPDEYLPGKVGAYVNYLGGGLRGSISVSDYNQNISIQKAEKLNGLLEACRRVYQNLEDDSGLNDSEYPDGETNWEAVGTQASRDAGVVSAY